MQGMKIIHPKCYPAWRHTSIKVVSEDSEDNRPESINENFPQNNERSVKTTDLGLWLVGSQWGGPEFDHVGKLGDGFDGLLGRPGEGLLVGRCPLDQLLGLLHQSLGRLRDVLPVSSNDIV